MCEVESQPQSVRRSEYDGSPIVAHVGELEPSVLVIPNPLGTEIVPKTLPIEVEYLQEDVVVEGADCHGSGT